MRRVVHSRLAWVLLGVLLLHSVGLGWGLPATDGWDNDGVAPRDFLVGVVKTFTPGDYYTYPPLHVILLAILTSPVWAFAILHASSLAPADLVHQFLTVPTMTAFALVARAVSAAMSLGVVYALAKVGEELRGRRAAILVATVVGLNAPFAYYAHTSNLDVPSCFWASFAILRFVRAMARQQPRDLRWAAAFAALAIATKDQTAALFALGFPLGLSFWFATDPWPRANARAVGKEVAIAMALAIGMVLALDGALVNPSGFRARIAFLVGNGTEAYAGYPQTLAGRALAVRDCLLSFHRFYPLPFAGLAVAGIYVATALGPRAKRAGGLAPMLCALSFFVLFNGVVRRTDERFVLPQMLLFGMYAGLGIDALAFGMRDPLARAMPVAAAALLAWGLFECVAVDVALVRDTRYDAEAWLAEHVRAGEPLEVYGNIVYLPRLPAQARVSRVDLKPADKRNPLVGAAEIVGRPVDVESRRPQWIVVTDKQMWVEDPREVAEQGRTLTPTQKALLSEGSDRNYFQDLLGGRLAYATAHVSQWTSTLWPLVDFHGSTAPRVYILERRAAP
jgi:hypothetical protein